MSGIETAMSPNVLSNTAKKDLRTFHDLTFQDAQELITTIPCYKYNENYLSV